MQSSRRGAAFAFDQRIIALLMGLSVGVVGWLTYARILSYFFTASDSLTIIETSRVYSLQDALGLFSQQLMGSAEFVRVGAFFRPLSVLTYGLDYLAWGLNPYGYHLTDLALHVIASVLVSAMLWVVTGGRKAVSWLGALIFTTHPILVEVVPGVARRFDVIAAIFMLLSLTLFVFQQTSRSSRRIPLLTLSVLGYAMALGAKEIAIILPAMVAACVSMLPCDNGNKAARPLDKARRVLHACFPYLVMTALYVMWRIHVIGGLGGYSSLDSSPSGMLSYWLSTIATFGLDLAFPATSLRALADSFGPGRLVILLVSVGALILLAAGLARRLAPSDTFRRLAGSHGGRIVIFLLVCLFLPLGLFLASLSFSHRSMYVPTIFFSAILSFAFVESVRQAVAGYRAIRRSLGSRCWSVAGAGIAVSSALMIANLARLSPLVVDYSEWRESGEVASTILRQLADAAVSFPPDARIRIYDLPQGIASRRTGIAQVKSVTYPLGYGIKSWLNFQVPGNRFSVSVDSVAILPDAVGRLLVESRIGNAAEIIVTIRPAAK